MTDTPPPLMPCPNGHTALTLTYEENAQYCVTCSECPSKTYFFACSKVDAVEFWNARAAAKPSLWVADATTGKDNPTPEELAELDSMCMTWRHDFFLLSQGEREKLRTLHYQMWRHHVVPLMRRAQPAPMVTWDMAERACIAYAKEAERDFQGAIANTSWMHSALTAALSPKAADAR